VPSVQEHNAVATPSPFRGGGRARELFQQALRKAYLPQRQQSLSSSDDNSINPAIAAENAMLQLNRESELNRHHHAHHRQYNSQAQQYGDDAAGRGSDSDQQQHAQIVSLEPVVLVRHPVSAAASPVAATVLAELNSNSNSHNQPGAGAVVRESRPRLAKYQGPADVQVRLPTGV